jgi:hypothetical protein|tara:strand:+ start:1747 stop:1908 length:162 start_codon:yes stop_codon:yes gene_type:complete
MGKKTNISSEQYKVRPNKVNISEYMTKDVKTSGIKVRGTGAATKGTMARGPMG